MNIPLILEKKYPGKIWLLNGDDYAGLEWLDESPKPTKSQLQALSAEVEFEAEVAIVEAQRQAAYQTESDPLFFKYQRDEDGVTKEAWLAKIEEIRQRYPMPQQGD